MNKPDYRRPLTVGVFIFIGLAIFITGVFTLGSQQKLFEKKFALKSVFDDVGGLQKGNNVWLSGLKVGTVKKISFCENSQVEITMSLEEIARLHIRKDARVKISTDGFIGNKIVVIYGGTGQTGLLADGDYLQSEKSISTDDMIAMLQANNQNLLEITGNFKKIASKIASGQGTVGGLINDPTIARDLRFTIRNLKTASIRTEESVDNIVDFTSKFKQENGLVNQLLSDTMIMQHLRISIAQLKEVVDTVSTIMNNLKTASNQLNDTTNPIGVLLHDEQAAKDLQDAIHHSKTSSEKLDQDLEALQHNFFLKGYFKKKEKEKPKGN